MRFLISFLSENLIVFIVIAILICVSLFSFLLFKNKINDKVGVMKIHKLSNKEYKTFCRNSDNAIVNTTVSFGSFLCKDKNEIDDMYSKTILLGNRILYNEGFKISKAGKV